MAERLHHNLARLTTEYAVMKAILERGELTRAQICDITRLSRPTVIDVLAAFRERSMIVSETRRSGGYGRDPEVISVNRLYRVGLGIDVGGSKIAAALVDLGGDIIAEAVEPTKSGGARALIKQLVALRDCLAADASIDPQVISSTALGIPGVLQPDGTILHAGNIRGLDKINVPGELSEALGCAVHLENDVNMAGLGEMDLVADGTSSSFVLISVGTGLGMAIVHDGDIMRGMSGRAGEIGFLPMDADLAEPDVRLHGGAETLAAGPALERLYATEAGKSAPAEQILALAAVGDAAASGVVKEYCAILARVVISAAVIVDPGFVVLSGGLGANHLLLEPLSEALRALSPFPIAVRTSTLGNRAGLMGAAALACRNNIADLLQTPHIDLSMEPGGAIGEQEPRRRSGHASTR